MISRKIRKALYNTLIILLLAAGAVYVCSRFIHPGVEYTDNAQVRQHITPVNTRIQGFIRKICFEEYQPVHKGDTLLLIEDAEFKLQLAQAEANLANARSGKQVTSAGMATMTNNLQVNDAGIEEARVQLADARREAARYQKLLEKDAVTRQQYDKVQTAAQAAQARYDQLLRAKRTTSLTRNEQARYLEQNQASIRLAEAAVELARLNLSYTAVIATCDGMTGREEIHEGPARTTGPDDGRNRGQLRPLGNCQFSRNTNATHPAGSAGKSDGRRRTGHIVQRKGGIRFKRYRRRLFHHAAGQRHRQLCKSRTAGTRTHQPPRQRRTPAAAPEGRV